MADSDHTQKWWHFGVQCFGRWRLFDGCDTRATSSGYFEAYQEILMFWSALPCMCCRLLFACVGWWAVWWLVVVLVPYCKRTTAWHYGGPFTRGDAAIVAKFNAAVTPAAIFAKQRNLSRMMVDRAAVAVALQRNDWSHDVPLLLAESPTSI